MKYLKVVQNASDIVDVVVPSVYYIKDTEEVRYYGDAYRPLTFVAREDGMTVSFTKPCSYSFDGFTWVELASNTATPAINTGEKICFRKVVNPSNSSIGQFSVTKPFDLQGNIMSMLFGQDYIEKNDLTGYNNCFLVMFLSEPVVDASKLILPATTLSTSCYASMFSGCTSLVHAPELPATTLATSCYEEMFRGTSLAHAPKLPATTLAERCYTSMFRESALEQAPELPATTLVSNCYASMFNRCTSLAHAPELPATTLASQCYESMFTGCTILEQAPDLLATTLVERCYSYMLAGCTNLKYVKMLATDVSAEGALSTWLYSVPNQGTFVKSVGVTIPSGYDGIPIGWTVQEV